MITASHDQDANDHDDVGDGLLVIFFLIVLIYSSVPKIHLRNGPAYLKSKKFS